MKTEFGKMFFKIKVCVVVLCCFYNPRVEFIELFVGGIYIYIFFLTIILVIECLSSFDVHT